MSDPVNGQSEGGYVFVSHSHKDIHEIRRIRNFLEENGLEPICFYLRCLSDDDEIIDLIKREIDAREWFLLVDSENARGSNWVKTEVEYIKSKDKDKMVSISLDKQDEIIPALTRLSNSIRVFFSYSRRDYGIAKAIYDECVKHDLRPFFDAEMLAGSDFVSSTEDAIKDASKHGCVVLLISENSVSSEWVKQELMFAGSEGAYILPVIIDDVIISEEFGYYVAGKRPCHLKTPITEEQAAQIVERIEELAIRRLNEK